jgi:hypothetical protein
MRRTLLIAGLLIAGCSEDNIGDWYVSPPLQLDDQATRVAAMWTAHAIERELSLEARGAGEDGDFGAWRRLELSFHEDELGVARVDLERPFARVQIRVAAADADLVALLTWTGSRPDQVEDADISQSTLGLAPELAAAGILSRASWGARAARCGNADRAKVRMAIHHTVSARTSGGSYEAVLRQTQAFHMDGRGYCDVGYHFFVTADGRVWEARNVDHVGGHSYLARGTVSQPPPPSTPPAGPSRSCGGLNSNEALVRGTEMRSCNGRYNFAHQGDGNVVLYNTRSGVAVWASNTHGRSTDLLIMQGDGNLVLYAPGARALWASRTDRNNGAWLAVQDDGNVVVYTASNRALWATNTVGR